MQHHAYLGGRLIKSIDGDRSVWRLDGVDLTKRNDAAAITIADALRSVPRPMLNVEPTEHGAYLSVGGESNSVYLTRAEIDQLSDHLLNGAAHKSRRFG